MFVFLIVFLSMSRGPENRHIPSGTHTHKHTQLRKIAHSNRRRNVCLRDNVPLGRVTSARTHPCRRALCENNIIITFTQTPLERARETRRSNHRASMPLAHNIRKKSEKKTTRPLVHINIRVHAGTFYGAVWWTRAWV